ncbi:probable aspartyl protease At4g16563 [Cajanus cajan]|uniref:Aspartic proteinase nepenthesin-1 n=1 Tax=Cajanus cajan TaxID=3821 RepID=A0A151SKS1_CAJCA|nr:probable aspartyl protease At4g16563 [Cajanus cajan]KYP55352.1 Aspartic proteinase nepenthesin-1 [Cajanus cajan]
MWLLLLFTMLSFPHPSCQMLLLPLTHTLSQAQAQAQAQFNATHHLLKSTSTRSAARFRRQLSLPLSPGSDYTLSFNLGRQAQPITLYMDTGSDLVWFPCAPFKCILCEGKPNEPNASPPTNITRSVAVSCKSPACAAAHNAASTSDLCTMARCPLESIETSDCASFKCPPFYYAYGDGSLIARLYHDTLSLSSLFLTNFTFGCAHTTLAEPTGVAGFGRGLLSLPAQLATLSPQLGNRFSYCLVSHSFDSERVRKPSPLILGRYHEKDKNIRGGDEVVEFVYTPMLENPKHPYFYCVGLTGISVGKRIIPAPEILRRVNARGDGGVVVDSGTTFTMLPAGFYNSVVAEFERRVGRVNSRARGVEERTGLAPCYYLKAGAEVPRVTLRFAGANSSVVLPRKNYFYEFLEGGDGARRRVGCLMMMNGGDESELSGGPGATLGNYQQQGFEVEYDLEAKRVGFAKRQCASLWERLNRDKN